MKAILLSVVTAATLVLPVAALAATYQYVNTQGNLETETAANPTQALTQPTDIAPNSGVILVTGTVVNDPSISPGSVVGTYTDQLTTGINPSRTLYLTLSPDGTVILSTIYEASSIPVMIESGTWTNIGNGETQVTITGNEDETYVSPQTFDLNSNGMNLVGSNYESSVYGTQGLTFTR